MTRKTLASALFMLCIIMAVASWQTLHAGEITCFAPGQAGSCTERVLQHVEFKSVVTEFVDPQDTGIGHSLSRLMWRQVLQSISNLSGAGVILAHDRQNIMAERLASRDYLDYLQSDYHEAAMAIAQFLEAQMSIWGVVLEDDGTVYFEPFVTLLPVDRDPWTMLRLATESVPGEGLRAAIPHRRLSFAPTITTREKLFAGNYLTRCALSSGCPEGIALRAGPSNDARVVGRFPVGTQIRAYDMIEQWLEVETQDGKRAFVNIYYLEMTPRIVTFASVTSNVNVHTSPGLDAPSIGKDNFRGDYPVLAVSRHANGEFWYRIKSNRYEGWIAGRLVIPNWSFPVVHFISGLYRYGRGDFETAIYDFERFIARAENEDNVTLAAAHQFLAASRIAYRSAFGGEFKLILEDLDKAVSFTPFDPSAYTLRAVVKIGVGERIDPALDDISKALELNPRDYGARRLLNDLATAARNGSLQHFAVAAQIDEGVLRAIDRLSASYPLRQ